MIFRQDILEYSNIRDIDEKVFVGELDGIYMKLYKLTFFYKIVRLCL